MIRVYAILVVTILVLVIGCEESRHGGQAPLPSELTELTLYDVDGLKGSEVTDEELGTITDYDVPVETTKMIFSQTRHKHGRPLWKGSRLGVAATKDGAYYRIAFSYYGGFFKILGHEGYYQALGPSRQELDLLIQKVLTQAFIPARKATQARP